MNSARMSLKLTVNLMGKNSKLFVTSMILITVLLALVMYSTGLFSKGKTVTLKENNNNLTLSKAPGPEEQDLNAKPFDLGFRELIRLTEDSLIKSEPKNIFNFFSEEQFLSVYEENGLGIKGLEIKIDDSGMFRKIEGRGQMVIKDVNHQCVEIVDIVNSDVLVLNCQATS